MSLIYMERVFTQHSIARVQAHPIDAGSNAGVHVGRNVLSSLACDPAPDAAAGGTEHFQAVRKRGRQIRPVDKKPQTPAGPHMGSTIASAQGYQPDGTGSSRLCRRP